MGVIYGALAGVSRRSQSMRHKLGMIASLKIGVNCFTRENSVHGHEVILYLFDILGVGVPSA